MNTNQHVRGTLKRLSSGISNRSAVSPWRVGRAAGLSLALVLAVLGLIGCSTASNPRTLRAVVDLSGYTKVVVRDFSDRATEREDPAHQKAKGKQMQRVCQEFPNRLATEIRKQGGFQKVSRKGPEDASTLVIGGSILHYEEGNAWARALVGFGAGKASFGVEIELRHGSNGALLAAIDASANSSFLPGDQTAFMTADDRMQVLAINLAKDVRKARSGVLAKK